MSKIKNNDELLKVSLSNSNANSSTGNTILNKNTRISEQTISGSEVEKNVSVSRAKKKINSSLPTIQEAEKVIDGDILKNETEYIYVIKEREFLRTQENIFKIGRTKQPVDNSIRRFGEYPKGSEPIFLMKVSNSIKAEADVLKMLKREYKQRTEYGKECFEGDPNSMIGSIVKLLSPNLENNEVNKKVINELKTKENELINTLGIVNEYKMKYEIMKNGLLEIKNLMGNQMQNFVEILDNFDNLSKK
jgi:hypothetical protein